MFLLLSSLRIIMKIIFFSKCFMSLMFSTNGNDLREKGLISIHNVSMFFFIFVKFNLDLLATIFYILIHFRFSFEIFLWREVTEFHKNVVCSSCMSLISIFEDFSNNLPKKKVKNSNCQFQEGGEIVRCFLLI